MIVFALVLLSLLFVIGGVAVDVANAYQKRTHLQVAADSAAHAALMSRETLDMDKARLIALGVARESLPEKSYGDTIRAEDIVFGHWDENQRKFTRDDLSRDAVLVETARLEERLNPEQTYFLNFIGLDYWDIRSQSVFVTYFPTCLREGFVAEDVVEVTSNNHYIQGFCIHSNKYVDLNNGSIFDDGTIVSMPDKRDIVGPTNMFDSNPGLDDALRDGSYKLRIVQRIEDIIAGVQDPDSIHYRSYITTSEQISLNRQDKLDETKFTEGRIHRINCGSQQQHATIHNDSILKKVVIVTNCKLNFGQGAALEDVVVVNTNTTEDSFGAASGVRLGRDDNCGSGGGAQLVTLGGVKIPAALEMYGGQILAKGDVSFTSNADGIQGASIISGGRIDGTTNSVMAFCYSGMEQNFEAAYFKLAG